MFYQCMWVVGICVYRTPISALCLFIIIIIIIINLGRSIAEN
jgi:hypothetical protein